MGYEQPEEGEEDGVASLGLLGCWALLGVVGRCWALLDAVGCYFMLLVPWVLLGGFGFSVWILLDDVGYRRMSLDVVEYR